MKSQTLGGLMQHHLLLLPLERISAVHLPPLCDGPVKPIRCLSNAGLPFWRLGDLGKDAVLARLRVRLTRTPRAIVDLVVTLRASTREPKLCKVGGLEIWLPRDDDLVLRV